LLSWNFLKSAVSGKFLKKKKEKRNEMKGGREQKSARGLSNEGGKGFERFLANNRSELRAQTFQRIRIIFPIK